MHRLSALAVSAFLLTPAGLAVADGPREPKPRIKGMELYSWKTDGKWQFALLTGTNRLKSAAEVKAPKNRIDGMKELKKALARLAVSENVFWIHRIKGFEYPDVGTRKDLSRYAEKIKIRLHTPQKP